MTRRGPITTHILDTARGVPAAGVGVRLERQETDVWQTLATGTTDADGRLADLLPAGTPLIPGLYRLTFATGEYLSGQGDIAEPFYPEVTVTFRTAPGQEHYHVPLLLSPYGYSTYRGS